MFDQSIYNIWRAMNNRCHNEQHVSFKYYGAKGVAVCQEWRDSFHQFAADMGPRPAGTSLDRLDSSGPYTKSNCRWATIVQQNNNKSDTRHITFRGRTMNLSAWAREVGASPAALHHRVVKMGMAIEDALTIPFSRSNAGAHGKLPRSAK